MNEVYGLVNVQSDGETIVRGQQSTYVLGTGLLAPLFDELPSTIDNRRQCLLIEVDSDEHEDEEEDEDDDLFNLR